MKPTVADSRQIKAVMNKLSAFKSMTSQERDQIEQHARIYVAKPGESVIEMAAEDRNMYFMLSGHAEVLLTEEGVAVATIQPGDMFGEMGFILGLPRTSWVVATDTSILLRINPSIMNLLSLPLREKIKDQIIIKLATSLDNSNKRQL